MGRPCTVISARFLHGQIFVWEIELNNEGRHCPIATGFDFSGDVLDLKVNQEAQEVKLTSCGTINCKCVYV